MRHILYGNPSCSLQKASFSKAFLLAEIRFTGSGHGNGITWDITRIKANKIGKLKKTDTQIYLRVAQLL